MNWSIISVRSKPIANNTYLIGEKGSWCYVIDPSFNVSSIQQHIQTDFTTIKAILLTHGHVDHIVGVDDLVQRYGCPVYLHPEDFWLLDDPKDNGALSFGMQVRVQAKVQSIHEFQDPMITIYDSPGHTPGGTAFYIPSSQALIAGDTLFHHGLGRTDLAGGSQRDLLSSRNFLLQLPVDTMIYSGHDESSTVAEERHFHRLTYK